MLIWSIFKSVTVNSWSGFHKNTTIPQTPSHQGLFFYAILHLLKLIAGFRGYTWRQNTQNESFCKAEVAQNSKNDTFKAIGNKRLTHNHTGNMVKTDSFINVNSATVSAEVSLRQ